MHSASAPALPSTCPVCGYAACCWFERGHIFCCRTCAAIFAYSPAGSQRIDDIKVAFGGTLQSISRIRRPGFPNGQQGTKRPAPINRPYTVATTI